MKRNLKSTHNSLVRLFVEHEHLSLEVATEKAETMMHGASNNIQYYVTTINYELNDIQSGARVKTPAEYFNNIVQAKIFQLNGILTKLKYSKEGSDSIHYNYNTVDIQSMQDELKELSETYPEYVL